MFNCNHMLVEGYTFTFYCLPIFKLNVHQQSACKELDCGCARIFNSPAALPAYATVFEEISELAHFEVFCSLNGPTLLLSSGRRRWETLVPFLADQTLNWMVVDESGQ